MGAANRSSVVALAVYVLAGCMVSTIRYRNFKKMTLWRRKPFGVFLGAVFALYIFVLIPEVAFFGTFLVYALSGPVEWTLVQLRERRETVAGFGSSIRGCWSRSGGLGGWRFSSSSCVEP